MGAVQAGEQEQGVEALAEGPLERLLRLGAPALSDTELLAVVVGGQKARAAREVAERLLAGAGALRAVLEQDAFELSARPGVGPARAARVLAAVELGRRAQRMTERRPRLRTPAEIDAWLRPTLAGLRREVFHVLCFNARNVLVRDVRVAEGTTNACPVDPREVFAVALAARATAVVLAHNHPSGDPEPSSLDVALTAQLVEGGRLLGVKVLDHLVLGESGFVSFLERGLMPVVDGGRRAWSEGW